MGMCVCVCFFFGLHDCGSHTLGGGSSPRIGARVSVVVFLFEGRGRGGGGSDLVVSTISPLSPNLPSSIAVRET